MPKEDPSSHPLATASRLQSLLEVQEGSVVSRVLIKKSTGTVTLFAFDKGEGLSEHSTPHDALVHILDGEAEITIGENHHRVAAGEGILLPASVPHALVAVTPFTMLLTMIREPG